MKRVKVYLLLLVIVISVSATAVSLYKKHNAEVLEDLKKEMTWVDPSDGEEEPAVDFSYLKELNPDIVAWIDIPNTEISYPILQSKEDKKEDYYLNHNVDGTVGYPASIYMQKTNSAKLTDPVTVLYGHNMKNGSMFAGLHEYKDAIYFDEHPEVYVYTPTERKHYRIFAVVNYDDRLILDAYDGFQTGDSLEAFYIESVKQATHVNYGVTVNEDSKLLVLSTCEKGQSEKRLLIEAVLVD